VSGKVLQRSGNVIAVDEETPSLKSEYRCHPHARDEVGVFTVTFLGAPPARIARQIKNGRKNLMRAVGSRFARCRGEYLLDKGSIPRAAERDRLRERGRTLRHESVERFPEREHGDPQSRSFDHIPLYAVCALRSPERRKPLEELTRAKSPHARVESRRVHYSDKVAVLIEGKRITGVIEVQLGDLLLKSHAPEEVFNPEINQSGRVFVERTLRKSKCRSDDDEQENGFSHIHPLFVCINRTSPVNQAALWGIQSSSVNENGPSFFFFGSTS
jgi:hypothetical protein